MTAHKNDMSAWAHDISCQRGHDVHASRLVEIDLAAPHAYADLPQVPARFARQFAIHVWDTDIYPVDGGPHCPAHDAVSETLRSHRIWEPVETILTLDACNAAMNELVIDMGAQIGWFSLLAASRGRHAVAYDADPECLRLIRASAESNGWARRIDPIPLRIGPDTPPFDFTGHACLAKVDVEGAEDEAVRVLWPAIADGRVSHLLVEVSPVFSDGYPVLCERIVAAGYRAYRLPPKQRPPADFSGLADLAPFRLDDVAAYVRTVDQANVWFSREAVAP